MSEQYDEFAALKLENQICFPLYAASRRVISHYRPVLSELDLTYTQYIVMLVLWEQEHISVKELGEKLFLDSGTLTPVLKSLEQKRLIDRVRSKEDERVLIANLTDHGREMKLKAASVPAKIACCISLTPDEAIELYRLLYKLLGHCPEE